MVKTIVSFDQPAEDVPAVEDSEESVAESAEEEGTVEKISLDLWLILQT